ncbi:hypothetical protein C8R45DRAFT_1108960 [Mycena sanguinolenta]|nr:hypothetical protein C8R45DRAFT_1108960 [Mycena sanguinolenta]
MLMPARLQTPTSGALHDALKSRFLSSVRGPSRFRQLMRSSSRSLWIQQVPSASASVLLSPPSAQRLRVTQAASFVAIRDPPLFPVAQRSGYSSHGLFLHPFSPLGSQSTSPTTILLSCLSSANEESPYHPVAASSVVLPHVSTSTVIDLDFRLSSGRTCTN